MKSTTEWLAGRTADFTPEEMASALAWIADVQRDAIEAAMLACREHGKRERFMSSYAEGIADGADRCEREVRALLPEGGA